MENIKIKLVAPRKNIPILVGKIEFFVNGIKIWADFKEKTTDISSKLGHPQTPLIINFGRDNPLFTVR